MLSQVLLSEKKMTFAVSPTLLVMVTDVIQPRGCSLSLESSCERNQWNFNSCPLNLVGSVFENEALSLIRDVLDMDALLPSTLRTLKARI